MIPRLAPPHMLGSELSRTTIPCWPNPSKLTVFLTKDADRFTGDLLFQIIFIFAAMFVWDDVVGRTLQFAGFHNLILLNNQYAYAASRIPTIKLVDFQLFEIAIFFSIAVWVARILVGIVYLKQYDRYFLEVSKIHEGKLYLALPFGAAVLFVFTYVKWHFGPAASFFVMRDLPRLYFSFISVAWFSGLWMIASSILFIIWQLFRQNRPGAVLWHDSSGLEGQES